MGSSQSSSSSSSTSSTPHHHNHEPSRQEVQTISKNLKLNQTLAIHGRETSESDTFNFWLCRVEEKASSSSSSDDDGNLLTTDHHQDSLLNCYGSDSQSGMFYFWLMRGRGGAIIRKVDDSDVVDDEDRDAALYQIRSPTVHETKMFLSSLLNIKENDFPPGLMNKGIHIFDDVADGDDDKYSWYRKKVMQDFMNK